MRIEGFLLKPVTKSVLVDTLVTLFSPESGETARASEVARDEGVRFDGLRILLFEDNEINQQVATELLEGVGAQVTVASDGRSGVERLEAAVEPLPWDVVLMDIQMPELDGLQATARLRAQPRFASLPIVAMTAHATKDEIERCTAVGMNDHVAKPIEPHRLYSVLARHHRPRGPAGPASGPAKSDAGPGLPVAPGLDSAQGLRRVAGNSKLYVRLLGQFADGQGDTARQFARAMAAGDAELAQRLAHTVRGSAANLGAVTVAAAAGALEKAVRDGADRASLDLLQERLETTLGALVTALRASLPAEESAEAPPPAPAPLDPQALRALVERWRRLLADCDAAAGDELARESDGLRGLLGAPAFPGFAKRVGAYDFDGALAALDAAAREKGL
jgi:two-component system sensor histidine kinase/response regulator